METNLIHQLPATFEGHPRRSGSGAEYWLAKTACAVFGQRAADHFVDVTKMVEIGITPEVA